MADEAATTAREAALLIAKETARLQLFTLELAATERALDKRAAEIVVKTAFLFLLTTRTRFSGRCV